MKIPGNRLFYGILSTVFLGLIIYLGFQTKSAFEYSNVLDQIYTNEKEGSLANGKYYKSSFSSKEETLNESAKVSKEIEGEGAVLLRNKNNALPLSGNEKVTCYSRSSVDLIYTGTGSGTVKISNPLTLKETLENDGLKVNPTLWSQYIVDTVYRTGGVMETPSSSSQMNIGESDIDLLNNSEIKDSLSTYNQVGIITISRLGGEGYDLPQSNYTNGKNGYLCLTEKEKALIKIAKDSSLKTVVLLNTANPFELGFLEEYDIDSCLWIGFPGKDGIQSIGDILVGKINPSGRLSDTYASSSFSAPAIKNSQSYSFKGEEGNTNEYDARSNYLLELEGIYVGYKYYETRYEDTVFNNNTSRSEVGTYNSSSGFKYQEEVIYPFGYGLSYTTFQQKLVKSSFDLDKQTVSFEIEVTNKGSVKGKDTVLLFHQSEYTPYDVTNKIEKASVNLVGFLKTEELLPNESASISLSVSLKDLASYDYTTNKTYILEKGENYFSIGSDAHDALNNILAKKGCLKDNFDYMTDEGDENKAFYLNLDSSILFSQGVNSKITNQFSSADINEYWPDTYTYFSRSDYLNTYPQEITDLETSEELTTMREDDYPYKEEKASSISFNQDNKLTISDFNSIDYEDSKWDSLLDQMSKDELLTLVSKGGFAVNKVTSINSPLSYDRDGPSGISGAQVNSSSGTLFPSEVVMASTFSSSLLNKAGQMIGEEALYMNVTGWYAPGANIHRSVFGGRNFEYFSEDSYLSGILAAQEIKGAQSKGLIVNIKHFALNEQELHRNGICIFNNEQAIREIYLKPFKIAVEEGQALGIMSSFTRIGTIWSGAHKGLLTSVLREEWGFKGRVITDYTQGKSFMSIKAGLQNGSDMWLCSTNTYLDELKEAANKDSCIYTLARKAAKNVLYAQSRSSAMNKIGGSDLGYWKVTIVSIDAFTSLLFVSSTAIFILKVIEKHKTKQV